MRQLFRFSVIDLLGKWFLGLILTGNILLTWRTADNCSNLQHWKQVLKQFSWSTQHSSRLLPQTLQSRVSKASKSLLPIKPSQWTISKSPKHLAETQWISTRRTVTSSVSSNLRTRWEIRADWSSAVYLVATSWQNPSDDAAVKVFHQKLFEAIESKAKKQGRYYAFKYLNDSPTSVRVFEEYGGGKSLPKLQSIAKAYGMFSLSSMLNVHWWGINRSRRCFPEVAARRVQGVLLKIWVCGKTVG